MIRIARLTLAQTDDSGSEWYIVDVWDGTTVTRSGNAYVGVGVQGTNDAVISKLAKNGKNKLS